MCASMGFRFKQFRLIHSQFSPTLSIHHQRYSHESGALSQKTISVLGTDYLSDEWTNVHPRILQKIGRNLHRTKQHPLCLIHERIKNFFYSSFHNRSGNPLFSVWDGLSPVVSTHQNFTSLLVPRDHPSWNKHDTYFLNEGFLLRGHTSAHQEELIKQGLDAFLVVGDVYRRDVIDKTHFPVFHQVEGVRLFAEHELFKNVDNSYGLSVWDRGGDWTVDKQGELSVDAVKMLEIDLKKTLQGLTLELFGKDTQWRWVDAYFPFTHPSWELEVWHGGEWLEVLGCGVIQQQILDTAGAGERVGWAFGLGLERLAMRLYSIPDIRLFWSGEPAFLDQFRHAGPNTPVTFREFGSCPPCISDMSFWTPEGFVASDFHELARALGGDLVESVQLIDEFSKGGRVSHCYRVTYRHLQRSLSQQEVNDIHQQIADTASRTLGVLLR